MLKLYIGPAGSGKTAAVMEEIRARVAQRQAGAWLIVPEQYSHEAERELCRCCGDTMSRFAEVFSFSGLARRVLAQEGGAAQPCLDKGGRLLCMALAIGGVGERLQAYRQARRRTEFAALMLAAVDELKSASISPTALQEAAEACDARLAGKLRDTALLLEAYDTVVARGHADPADRLTKLAEKLPDCAIGPDTQIFVDGFIDFTRQERELLRVMLRAGATLTVCLTLDALEGGSEIFSLSRTAARALAATAGDCGTVVETRRFAPLENRPASLRFFEREMFGFSPDRFAGDAGAIELIRAENAAEECEFAAARALALVRGGCRWRDIAVAARGFEDYRPLLESIFAHYGVPLYLSRRSELLQKPLPSLLGCAFELLEGGWEVDELISYLRTGLTGLSVEDCDELENYVFKWQLRAGAWRSRDDWKQHPDGFGAAVTEESEARLAAVNTLRRRVAAPLLRLERRGREGRTAAEQAAALALYLEELRLPETLEARAEELAWGGQESLAAEYRQLWELIVSALEQCEAILGDLEMDLFGFGRLFCLMLSQYDIGTIPVALDRVSAGDFDRMRRRSIKHLIVLGAADGRLPPGSEPGGLFSEDEREQLLALNIDLGGVGESELWREFALIYHTLSLPSETLTLCYPQRAADGEALRPAFVFRRAEALFSLPVQAVDATRCRLAAPAPALTLAAHALRGGGTPLQKAAAACLQEKMPERFAPLLAAASLQRGSLSAPAVESLYGRHLYLTASRVDRFSSCRFAYFCQYGLRAQPYVPATFSAPEIGSFLHFLLETTARALRERGGFAAASDDEVLAIAHEAIEDFVHRELNDFQEKTARFVYLFRRLCRDAERIVLDTVRELRRSDFEPLDFELNFSRASDLPPVELGGEEGGLTLTGVADRVDGWLHEGKLYLRVVDYKSGKTKFSLSDVWYGMGMQMLLYLFTLGENGAAHYGHEIVPAGVMYLPARAELLSESARPDDATVEAKHADALRRSGLVLSDGAVLEAWEKGEDKRYIPVRFKKGAPVGALADAEQLGRLSRHVKKRLREMAAELRRGSIAADPYFRNGTENACHYCDYADACLFSDGEGGERCRCLPKLKDEQVWANILEEEGEHA